MRRYSKHSKPVIPTRIPGSPIDSWAPSRKPPHRIDRKVNTENAAQLVADYESGVPATNLILTYDLRKDSVLKLLKEAGIQWSPIPVTNLRS